MDTSSTTAPQPAPAPRAMPAVPLALRPFYWSVRRELWESPSIYRALLVAAAVVLLGFIISLVYVPPGTPDMTWPEPARRMFEVEMRHDVAAVLLIAMSVIVGMFYCQDALHGERRDRSILFWKSLPVSDATTVLAKASIPMIVLPVIAFVTILALQLVMLLLGSVVMLVQGHDAGALWQQLPFRGTGVLLYGLIVLSLWYAPVYGWLLLISGWARRATLLWAVLPPVALCVVERIGFGTSYVWRLLAHRLGGGFNEAFVSKSRDAAHAAIGGAPQIDVVRFVSSLGLWIGLAVAAALLFAAIRMRRSAEPI